MISNVQPDIVIGTESWLKAEIANVTVFPMQDYDCFRKDRGQDREGGGVFILAKKDLVAEAATELDTNCELIWCKIQILGSKIIHVGSYYRPHIEDEESLVLVLVLVDTQQSSQRSITLRSICRQQISPKIL